MDHQDIKLSVIIPVYNREKLIVETLESIKQQSFHNWQCILVDDGSTDGTFGILNKYAQKDRRIKVHKRPENITKGPGACRNFGLSLAEGELIHFFDSDDLLKQGFYENIIKVFDIQDYDYVLTRVALFENDISNTVMEYPQLKTTDFLLNGIEGTNMFFTQNVIWQRSFLNKTKELFDEKISMCEDFDFDMRNFMRSDRLSVRNDLFVYLRKHDSSLSRKPGRDAEKKRNFDRIVVLKKIEEKIKDSQFNSSDIEYAILNQIRQFVLLLIKNNFYKRTLIANIAYINNRILKRKKYWGFIKFNCNVVIISILSLLSLTKRSILPKST